ncbi:MAG: putative salt-induced outer membrane protein [Pseudohongiellaceae bacterium]|jgi:putative salt-induced outer membrane protein
MKNRILMGSSILAALLSTQSFAQRENGLNSKLELGIIQTTGNTEDESFKVKGGVELVKNAWDYAWSVDAFRSSRQNQLTAQRFYTIGSADYQLSEVSFVEGRLAYEDDRFSGYDSQTDASINYGRSLLTNTDNMNLSITTGIGARRSLSEEDDFDEVILRLAGNYKWDVSESALFNQLLSVEAGDQTSIYRLESSIETNILENLSLKFTFNVKHQTEVPIGREKSDTATSVTLVMNF